MSSPAPLASHERLPSLDLLRGFALLGIFIMNMPAFAQSPFADFDGGHSFPAWYDRGVEMLRGAVLDGKFNSLLSFLFAIGFTLQIERLRAGDAARGTWLYLRRIGVLLGLGVLHGWIFWSGDVLHIYALLGLFLLGLSRLSDRAVILSIGGIFLLTTAWATYRVTQLPPEHWVRLQEMAKTWKASNDLAYGQGGLLDAMRETFRMSTFTYTNRETLLYSLGFYLQMLTTMLLGLLAGRHRWIQRADEHAGRLPGLQWRLFAVGVAMGLLAELAHNLRDPLHPGLDSIAGGLAYRIARPCVMGFYVVTLLRLAASPSWGPRLAAFGAVGRMPLTTYLTQTALGTAVFFHWGLGFWNKVGPAGQLALALTLYFGVQLPLARWWLARHEQGPLETLWRRLTYGKRSAEPVAVPVSTA